MARIKNSSLARRLIAITLCVMMVALSVPISSLLGVMAASGGTLDGTVLKIDYDPLDGPSGDITTWLDSYYGVDGTNIGDITAIEINGDLDADAFQVLGYIYGQQVIAGTVNLADIAV